MAQYNRGEVMAVAQAVRPSELPYKCGSCGTTHVVRNVTHGATFQCIVKKMAEDEAQMAAGVKARAAQVQALLAQRKNEEAVRAALEDPPIHSKNTAVKDENAQVVMTALVACNKGEVQRAIDALSSGLEDNLMKYLARFLGLPSQSAAMLDWHQRLAAKAGSGCIMRAFTERKQV
ncbi:hypothetical protein BBJ28_00016628 [Nothophytophthora sp. Chile5]|nr:hypothetical protein BBJ28_00016628 [Nothophytophthora sp. Chile5]